MKQNYSLRSAYAGLKNTMRRSCALALVFTGLSQLSTAQQTFSFTTAGNTGPNGPTQAQINTAYASTNLNGTVVSVAGIQTWTVASTGIYQIDIAGARGGSVSSIPTSGGAGARMKGTFSLNAGDVIRVLVGQKATEPNLTISHCGSGGGGTYVTANNVLLIAAGGGGGAGGAANSNGVGGVTVTAGTQDFPASVAGGSGGNGGSTCQNAGEGTYNAGGGGGYNSGTAGNGQNAPTGGIGGLSFLNGGTGGSTTGGFSLGGFGGGGGTHSNYSGGGGGGGYSGGAGGNLATTCISGPQTAGGGGGSYNTGTNQSNAGAANADDGFAIFTQLCDVNLTASGNNSISPVICSGQTVTLSTNAVSGYSWSTGNTTQTIAVSPTITTSYTVTGTSALSCTSSAVVTITVSTVAPTLTVSSSSSSICLGNTLNITATGALNYTITNGSTTYPNGINFTPTAGVTTYTVKGDNGCGTPPTSIVNVTVTPLAISITPSSTLVCSGTPATLTAAGALNYSWSPGISTQFNTVVFPASTSIYTLVGKTGACSNTVNVTITTKPNPTLTIIPSQTTICNGTAINLVASGNATSYAWSTGQSGPSISATPTTLTLYTATGTGSNNCVTSVQQVIYVNPTPTITASAADPVVCLNSTTTLNVSGATTYTWSNNATGASIVINSGTGTTFSVTGSFSTGCSSNVTVSISLYTPTVGVSANTVICAGAHVIVSGNSANTYTWTNNGSQSQGITVSPAANTIYTVTGSVSDPISGISCLATNTVEVDVNPNPAITVSSNRAGNAMCNGESALLTGAGAGATGTYLWTGGSGAVTSITLNVSPINNQSYTVTGTDANGCKGSASIQISVEPCLGISPNTIHNTSLLIYPNPSTGEFTISSDQDITLQITSELGQQVRTVTLSGKVMSAKINNLSNGVYFITGQNENGLVKEKIIIAK